MVTTSSFLHAPTSRLLTFVFLSSSLLVSILQIKHYLPIKPIPHLWPYLQLWRVLSFQLASISSTEVFSSLLLFYNFRVLERLWGSRKYASFIIVSWMVCGALTAGLGVVMKLVSLGYWEYIPPGMTAVVICVLAVWKGEVPRLGGVKLVLSEGEEQQQRGGGSSRATESRGILFSDKFTMYILAAQLALSQFPYQLMPAAVGWVVGNAWREEMLPSNLMRWRVPSWMVGEAGAGKVGRQYEGLRRRLEEEGGSADGMREVSDGVVQGNGRPEERRGFARTMMGYFGGGS